MSDNYLAYWGMTKAPFSLTPDPDMLYLSTQHSECLMRLKYAIFSQKGGSLLVSDNAGNGKTSVLARLKNDLNDYYGGRVRVVFIDHPTLTPIEMIGEISNQLGGELHTTEKIRALNYLRDKLFSLYNENIKVVVIVDEGQMLKDRPDILGELRILLNFCVADAFLLTFIFSGQKPLDSVLREMPEFWQRLPVRFFLRNLDYNDTRGLVRYRLEQVGCDPDIFTDDACQGIYNYSEGCPRIICAVADLCLVVGYAKGVKRIGFVEVSTACRDMESSGDGFHYYAYAKAQNLPSVDKPCKPEPPSAHRSQSEQQIQPEQQSRMDRQVPPDRQSRPETRGEPPEPETVSADNAPEPDVSETAESFHEPVSSPAPVRPTPSGDLLTVACPSCSEPNDPGRRFCASCDYPLYTKCAECGTLIDTLSGVCGTCGADMEKAHTALAEQVAEALKPYDILENGSDVWLRAADVTLINGERVLAVFPRGNMLTPGPKVEAVNTDAATGSGDCDFLLTDRRLLIRSGDDDISCDLVRIESCGVTDVGGMFGRRPVLLLGIRGISYSLRLPYKAKKAKPALDTIASFIQREMLS